MFRHLWAKIKRPESGFYLGGIIMEAGQERAIRGAPMVLFIVLQYTGCALLGCHSSPINPPYLDKLAGFGYHRYFHA